MSCPMQIHLFLRTFFSGSGQNRTDPNQTRICSLNNQKVLATHNKQKSPNFVEKKAVPGIFSQSYAGVLS